MHFVQSHPNDFLRIFRWCKRCGAEIEHLPPHVRYCDRECHSRHANQRAKARRAAKQIHEVHRVCVSCGTDISQRRKTAKYCSKRCAEIAYGQRLAEPIPLRHCALPECSGEFQPHRSDQRCCSEKHGKLLYNRESRADGRQKPPPWSDARRDRYHRRRALKKATSSGDPVLLTEIAARDKWRCHLCGIDIDPNCPWPDSMSPSLDHVVPLSLGGAHAPENVRLAHLGCNSAKGNRGGGEPLLLTG
ncbi:HNH endonuclease [Streptomyces sp. R28]|uniref:HNH endonuclease n=1 Tax=Streptomyces sp. R28 TaxID=3238628 RepID=A0AB39PRY8_9ACTN